MKTRDILIVILLASLGVSGVFWLRANFEQETDKVRVGFRGEAQRNPWLAAERLLARMNLPASDLREYDGLRKLQPDSVLVLPQGRQTLSESLRAGIVDWVQSGGFLVIEAERPSIRDPLIDAFGVMRVEDKDNSKTDEHRQRAGGISRNNGEFRNNDEYKANANHIDSDSLDLTVLKLPGSALTSLVWMEADFSLVSERAWFRAGTDYSANILMLREGDGNVVVVTDLDFATNGEIADLDHAQFVVELAHFAQRSGPVIFFINPGQPSLMQWLLTHAWAPASAAALAVLLWLWKSIPRFGPVAPDPERARRRLLDHLRASGRFLWARGQGGRLLEVSREACLRKLSRTLPDFETATESTQASRLIRMFGISSEQAQQILSPQAPGKMLHFMHTIQLYQTIHARLALHQAQTSRLQTSRRTT
jgi:hypothetical protein